MTSTSDALMKRSLTNGNLTITHKALILGFVIVILLAIAAVALYLRRRKRRREMGLA